MREFVREFGLAVIVAIVLLAIIACICPAQQPQYAWQRQWVQVPGQYYAVPRSVLGIELPITTAILGPRLIFIPQQQRPVPGPVAPYPPQQLGGQQ